MDGSILNSIKKLLGFDANYKAFDLDIIMHINSVFAVMHQLGATPPEGFEIEDETAVWSDFIQGRQHVNMVKTYMYQKVKLMFDPPATSFALEALKGQVTEFEFRLSILEFVFNPNPYVTVLLVDEEDLVP